MTHHPAHPIGIRLGVTLFWQHASMLYVLMPSVAMQCLAIGQWLTAWFTARKIYLLSTDVVDVRKDRVFIGIQYVAIPLYLYAARKKKFRRLRRRSRRNYVPRLSVQKTLPRRIRCYVIGKLAVTQLPISIISRLWLRQQRVLKRIDRQYWPWDFGLKEIGLRLGTRFYKTVRNMKIVRRFYKSYPKYERRNKRFDHFFDVVDMRVFWKAKGAEEFPEDWRPRLIHSRTIRRTFRWLKFKYRIKPRARPHKRQPTLTIWDYRKWKRRRKLRRRRPFFPIRLMAQKRQPALLKVLFSLTTSLKYKIRRSFSFRQRIVTKTFRRYTLTAMYSVQQLRFLWLLKITIDRYFNRICFLTITNIFQAFFQVLMIPIISLRQKTARNRYISGIRYRRSRAIRYFRKLYTKFVLRNMKEYTPPALGYNRFSYFQTVLFLSSHPMWRKISNVYILSYLVIVASILKNTQVISQWLYNVLFNCRTRRLKSMRMRFFGILAKMLRDFGLLGRFLHGFRMEVRGKTGRAQKTSVRYFGDTRGIQRHNLLFRSSYQASDICTYAGILGVRIWLF
jgi:hypothetical protein